jgi:uncharacterized membrane protein
MASTFSIVGGGGGGGLAALLFSTVLFTTLFLILVLQFLVLAIWRIYEISKKGGDGERTEIMVDKEIPK